MVTLLNVNIFPIPNFPIIKENDDIVEVLLKFQDFKDGDILVIAHTIISRSEKRSVSLSGVKPSIFAEKYAKNGDKDPRQVELVLREAQRIIRMSDTVLITETCHGFVCANSGVDRSNSEGDTAVLLPIDPDASAQKLFKKLVEKTGLKIGIIISDTFGRPFRVGTVNVAIGIAGVMALEDFRGKKDLFGKELLSTIVARADELAAAAGLVMGQADEGTPIVVIRGASKFLGEGKSAELVREPSQDLFRS